ncbi:unnamed protein product [Arctia plantaginis]|uniref:Cubilin n=2 Tax=Arctia plantaginis TaxID=874455 RepID=A0A8S0ZQD8_ARCPL|nr:unnamed protein product [Arctia plantaginis]
MTFTFLFIFTILFGQLDCEIYQDRPKIKTLDGDLVLEAALDKNIYIRPNGPKSKIFVGNIDILKSADPQDTDQHQQSNNRMNEDLEEFLNRPNGILQRLERLENVKYSVPESTLYNITMLWRRLNNLKRKILDLENQIVSRSKDECDSHPCQHGGTCLNLINGYHCLCPQNWEGRDCDEDVNECRNFAGTELGCQNGATCINKPGTYECLCKTGWYGLHCTTKAKDCSSGDFEMCGYGTCIPVTSGEGIKCICHQGWTSNATSVMCLTDINECESYQGPRCSVNPKVECINLPGSFRCGQCPTGYEGDGYICNDIDECTTVSNGGCSPMVSCHNTIGSRICGPCPTGYQGDGVTCTFRGSCNINHGGCHPSAQCVESLSPTGQTSLCLCPEGMDGDGVGLMGCYISTANYTRGCESKPCGNHGRCHSLRSGYTCICNKGFGGAKCDVIRDVCAVNPCQNGGICRDDDTTITGFRCECTALYTGSTCQIKSKTCGGILDAEEGSLAYPISNTTATHNHNAQCAWVIYTAPEKVINVTFSKFNLEQSLECNKDFLQIHDGRKSSSQLIGRFCGSTFPKGGNIISTHNNLYLWFHSDRIVTQSGFALHWTSMKPVCGGDIDAITHGLISSPGSPGSYPENRDCYWHLTTTPGKRINLNFFALDIEVHSNCSFDYLAIYDGGHVTDPLLSRYCNTTQPAPVVSASSEMLIHFHSDSYGSGKGFQIAYAPVEGVPGCGGYFTADKGEIVSPTYNGNYLTNLLCEYKIRTSPATRIKIDFKQFSLERSFRCKYDYLKVYDGPSADSPFVGRFCGNTYPATYTSSSNTLYIKFRTDRSNAAEGFRITYNALCVKTILGDSGVIKSPLYPFNYPRNKDCVYIIKAVPGKAIQLRFQDFDIEDNTNYNCRYDYVEVRDGPDVNSTLLGRFCGGSEHIPPVQTSTHNFMYIRFKSDMTISGTGFYANYTTIDTECGGIYRESTGLINHPSGDASIYKNGQSCQWLLIAPEGMHIKLTWNRFDLEDASSCNNDYLKLFEIDNNEEVNLLGTYCGTHFPPALTTSTNRLKLLFESDNSARYAGFSVSYAFLDERSHCGGNYVKAHGFIYSPGWPNAYEPNRDCTWTITVPIGQQISLNISNFDLERSVQSKCNHGDYLEIRNGASETAPLIGQYCGKFRYKRIVSLTNVLHLHFHSDFYLTGTGFKIEWDGTITGCGGTLTGVSGTITSPNYPNDYHNNAECFYRIVTSTGSRVRISFTDLELERSTGSCDDYIEIFDGRDTRAPSLGKYCVLTDKSNVVTTTNIAYIKFRSDVKIGAKGFMLNYITLCNNNLTGRYGVIESPNYPNSYPMNSNCLWNIQAPKGNKINVTFTHFNIQRKRMNDFNERFNNFNERFNDYMRHSLLLTYNLHNNGICYEDYMQVKETLEPNFSDKLCGTTLPSPITTKSNSLQIKFVSGIHALYTGFRLEWVSYGCGGHIQKPYGTLSLDRLIVTEKEIECEWLIETSKDKAISITFTNIYMSDTKHCNVDAIEIYNGPNIRSPLLAKLCNQGRASIDSDNNFMLVRLVKQSTLEDVHFTSQYHSTSVTCGGFINSVSGFIYSKNYPKNYDKNLDCIWYIKVPANHRIEINFLDLDLYADPNYDGSDCRDSILIYDDNDYKLSPNYTYRICPNSNTTQIVTKYSNVIVQFKTESGEAAKGFKANFSITCGSILIAKYDGIIENNRFIRHMNKSCIWTIIAPELDQKISLTFTHMSLPKDNDVKTNRNCPSTFLRVFDGNDEFAPLKAEYCGRKVPPMIVSHGNAITIELGSYTDRIAGMFSAHYSPISNACGGTLTAEAGTITSPAYPSSYPINADCEWLLSTSPGNTISITFEQFNLEYSEGCNEDYVEIRENDRGGHLFGVYCGNEIPTNYTKAAKIFIKFHSNSKTSGQGFILHYSYLHENDIEGDSGEIASPFYPNIYEGPGEYVWRIMTFGADVIAVTIDSMEISSYDDVSYNKLIIYDGYDNTAPILEQLHGALGEPKLILASSNTVYIVLTLDESNTGSTFHMTWTKSSVNGESSAMQDRINCGSNEITMVLPGNTSELKSPNYPMEYGNDLNCEWIYRTEVGRHLSITFTDFNLEEAQACYADSISIFSANTPNNWEPIKQNLCQRSSIQEDINSSVYLKIKFKTDSYGTKKGFLAQVSSVCGGLITTSSGEIGPMWIDAYNTLHTSPSNKLKCKWTVKVRPGKTIQLRFSDFNITNINDNCLTYVVLRNGDSEEAPLLESGKYCGYEHENHTNIETLSNSLFVSYTTQIRNFPFTFQSFKIYYEEKNFECGSTSELSMDHKAEIISSPNYPDVPIPYSECVWIFSGPPGEILRIDFVGRFDLDYTENCGTEAIEIRDGSSSLSPLLKGPYCGEKPGTIKSSSNKLYVKYMTQLLEPRNGFRANISIDICGGTIIAESGVVKSPGYPVMQVLSSGTVCSWYIIGPPSHVFSIKPEDVGLPLTPTPCATKIELEESTPVNNTITTLKTICNDDFRRPIPAVETSSNKFTIKLTFGKQDAWNHKSQIKGFRISFYSSRPMCGGTITSSEGYLSTPNYPQETTLKDCHWRIRVPNKSRRVRLELIDTNPENHRINLYNDMSFHTMIVSIPDGNSTSDNKIIESVGNELAISVLLNTFALSHRFKAKFSSDEQALCGGELGGNSLKLMSPDLQRSYSCKWHYNNQISTVNQNNITYTSIFISLSTNSSTTTTRNRCGLFDSRLSLESSFSDTGLSFRRKICGNTETSYRIPSSVLEIRAAKRKTDLFYFNLNIKSQPCGGKVQVGENASNIFKNIPDFYSDTVDCAWLVIAPINSRVEIKLEGSFLLECDDEYVIIMQSVSQDIPAIGRYCKGMTMENALLTHYSYMTIQYHSKPKPNTNIKVMAKTVTHSCGGLLTFYDNVFTSPNYPKMYSANQECLWEIKADTGYRISLRFFDRFAIEDRKNCTKDVLIIYDWIEDTYNEIGRVCGRQTPLPFNSTNNRMKVVFRTDAETNLDGFKALWIPICGGKYMATQKEQILFSPGYPYNYKPYMNCSYEIDSLSKQKVILKFLEFDLEGNYPECAYDNLTVTAQRDYENVYQVFCGTVLPSPIRNFEKIGFQFRSDSALQGKGFKISYAIFTCGGKINDTTVITSSYGDENYDGNMNCTWFIEAPPSKIVIVNFIYIDLENSFQCYNDYVALYDGRKVNGDKRLALLCGFINSTTVLRSTGNKMVLEFITDSVLQYKGFKAQIYFSYSEAAGCGGRINITDGATTILKSPLMGNNVVYENFLDCHWSITSPPNTVIKITFTQFHISPCENINQTAIGYSKCDCDLVEIKDGLNPSSLIIGTYCGHTMPSAMVSSDNVMSVRLSTDGELVSSGFQATLTAQPTPCGQSVIRVSSTPHRYKSPGYDTGSIPRGLHCVYHLDNSDQQYSQIRITVINLQLRAAVTEGENVKVCKSDRLILSSSLSHSNITLGKNLIMNLQTDDFFTHYYFYDSNIHYPNYFELCGHLEAVDYYVYGPSSINIITSAELDSKVHKGVEIEIAFVGYCGRNYTELQGRIQNSYRTDDDPVIDCYTLITAPVNYTISAYFLSIVPDYYDSNTYFKIYDGNKTNAKQLFAISNDYENNYPVFSTGRHMLLHSHQNNGNVVTFDLNYVTSNKGNGCGGKLHNAVGTVTSPFYPKTYRHKNTCEWELETPVGTYLLIRFNEFDLGLSCNQNYLQLVNSRGDVVRTFCSETPADYRSNDNYVKLVYHTSMNNAGNGWTANFVATRI